VVNGNLLQTATEEGEGEQTEWDEKKKQRVDDEQRNKELDRME
jgi:hypothetical protein